jgi:7,8-dihydro-6-hydroxymethylpterin-pyrophosphokinase
MGRVRGEEKNAPRTIDIDVVICGNQTLDNDIWEHAHAAVPVAEISPHIRNHPFQGTLGQVAQKLQAEISILKCPEISQQIKSLVEDVPFDPSLKQVNH